MTGGVDDVELVSLPEGGYRGGRNRNAAFLFLGHPVRRRRTVVGFAKLVVDAGVEEDTFGSSGFAGIDVCHDADVTDLLEVGKRFHFLCHVCLALSCVTVPRSHADLVITSGSERKPCWLPPYGEYPRGASQRHPGRWRRRESR